MLRWCKTFSSLWDLLFAGLLFGLTWVACLNPSLSKRVFTLLVSDKTSHATKNKAGLRGPTVHAAVHQLGLGSDVYIPFRAMALPNPSWLTTALYVLRSFALFLSHAMFCRTCIGAFFRSRKVANESADRSGLEIRLSARPRTGRRRRDRCWCCCCVSCASRAQHPLHTSPPASGLPASQPAQDCPQWRRFSAELWRFPSSPYSSASSVSYSLVLHCWTCNSNVLTIADARKHFL